MRTDSRLRETFRYELGYRFRSASTWLYGGFVFLLAFWIIHVDNTGSHTITGNAPFRLAEITSLFCGLFGMLVTAGLFSDAALRDRSVRMDPLLFTTRLRPDEYLAGRYLAALAVNAVLLLATPLGLWIATLMPYLDRDGFGPNRLSSFVQPVLLFSLPNLVLVSAVLFAIAVRSRQVIAVYLGLVAIFIGYIVAANYWGSITSPLLSALADPLGVNALKRMTQYWTASERNVRTIGFPAMLVWNRVLWMTIAAGLVTLVAQTFRFTERFGRVPRSSLRTDEPQIGTGADAGHPSDEVPRFPGVRRGFSGEGSVPRDAGVFGRRTRRLQTLAVTRDALADIVSGWPFRVAFVAAIGLVVLWGWNVGTTLYETITWPVTHLVAGVVLAERAILVPWVVIVLFAGELVWKDRESGSAEIADALPVRTGTILIGRFLAMVAIIALFQVAFMIGGILLQVLHGYYVFEPLLYLKILFGFKLADFILLAALAMTVHVLVNQKYVGHLLMIMLIVFCQGARYHRLLVYNSAPQWTYSDMNGLGPFVAPFIAYKLYWAAWALLLGVLAFLFWPRGPEQAVRMRLAAARARFGARPARLTALAVTLIVILGGFIFYNTNILNRYVSWDRAGITQAEYERRYGRYRDLPQPVITDASLRLEVYPEKPAVDMRGTYRLTNRTSAVIRSVHVKTPDTRGYEVRTISFGSAAKLQLADREHGYHIFELARPLAPGQSLEFRFDTSFRPRGFPHGAPHTKIVENGTYFDRLLFPFIGYQPFEVTDAKTRSKHGLPARKEMPDPRDPGAARHWHVVRDGDRMHVETVVGTSLDQTAIVPGMLRRSWTENGRRYFHYASRIPETFGTAVFSARYAVRESEWENHAAASEGTTTNAPVKVQVFHHPPHDANPDRMIAGVKSALDYYTAQFGPYPYREFRIVEITPYTGINGRAFPAGFMFGEQNFITRDTGSLDLTFFGTAHEVAHQWWGGQVRPAYAKGRSFVSEALANYSAMMVTEKVLGPAAARDVYDFQMNRYLTKRGEFGRDVPLLEVDDHPYVSYGKGAVALYTLREHIGEEAMNGALKRFLEKYGRSGPPYPTSLDLYAELRAATPPHLHGMLSDLFETITLWDFKTQSATSRRLADGRYEVTLNVLAQKLRADGVGRETTTPMNDLVEVAVFAEGKDEPIYQARHRITTGQQTLKVIVAQPPSRAGIDAQGKLIERVREDNVVEMTTSS